MSSSSSDPAATEVHHGHKRSIDETECATAATIGNSNESALAKKAKTEPEANTSMDTKAKEEAGVCAAAAVTGGGEEETEQKEPEPVTEASAFAWFKQNFSFLTRHMLDTQPELFDAVVNDAFATPSAKARYDDYVAQTKQTHDAWKERHDKSAVRRADLAAKAKATGAPMPVDDQEETEPPSTPLSQASWLFWIALELGLVTDSGPAFLDPQTWSDAVLARIAESATDGVSIIDRINHLIRAQDSRTNIHPDAMPVAMLTTGIVTQKSAAWLADGPDLDKLALAHGSKATTRETKLRDIFIEQVKTCREFVDRRFPETLTSTWDPDADDDDEGPGAFCVVRAILENSRKALGLRTLADERPEPGNRAPLPIAGLIDSGYTAIDCMQCGAKEAVVLADAGKAKDRVLQRLCETCWNLPAGWRALLTVHDA